MARVVAVTMCKDEADAIGHTIRHLLAEGIDHVIVADNLSSDDTRPILDALAETLPVTVVDDPEVGYFQDRKMTDLAHKAASEFGAEWVLPFDADEIFYSPHGTLAEFFAVCVPEVVVIHGWDHVATDDDDPLDPNPFTRITNRRQNPQRLGKVAFRYQPTAALDFGNHDVRGVPGPRVRALHYRHFQYRSFEHMARKVRQGATAYEVSGLSSTYGTHWRELGGLSDGELWKRWRRMCEEPDLICDPAPAKA